MHDSGMNELLADLIHFDFFACFSCQDHDLPHYICTAEIKSWIGFCITFILCLLYYIGKFSCSHHNY